MLTRTTSDADDLRSLIRQLDGADVPEYDFTEDIALTAKRKLRIGDTIRAMHARRMARQPGGNRRKRAALAIAAAGMGFGASGMVPPTPVAQAQLAAYQAGPPSFEDMVGRVPARKLTASDELREAMIEEEGVRTRVYRDIAGYLTVGIGHLVRAGDRLSLGDRISRERILDFFDEDIALAEAAVRRMVGDTPLHQHEFDAMVDLVYNVGEGNVSLDRSPRLNAALDEADYDAVAEELTYTHARGQTAEGLIYRSQRRAQIFQDAVYTDPRNAA